MDYITVRVGKVPGTLKDVTLNGDRTVGAALRAAEMSVEAGFEVKVDGDPADTGTRLTDGAHVLIVKKIKGA